MLWNTNNSFLHKSFVSTPLNGFQYSNWFSSFILPIDWAIKSTTTLGQSVPGCNDNEAPGLEPDYQIQFSFRFFVGGFLTSARCCRCILQPQQIGQGYEKILKKGKRCRNYNSNQELYIFGSTAGHIESITFKQ